MRTEPELLNERLDRLATVLDEIMPSCANLVRDAIDLLKEQEAVEPKSKTRHGATTMVQHWCGNCMVMLHGKPKYCPNCGRKVKWE